MHFLSHRHRHTRTNTHTHTHTDLRMAADDDFADDDFVDVSDVVESVESFRMKENPEAAAVNDIDENNGDEQ